MMPITVMKLKLFQYWFLGHWIESLLVLVCCSFWLQHCSLLLLKKVRFKRLWVKNRNSECHPKNPKANENYEFLPPSMNQTRAKSVQFFNKNAKMLLQNAVSDVMVLTVLWNYNHILLLQSSPTGDDWSCYTDVSSSEPVWGSVGQNLLLE